MGAEIKSATGDGPCRFQVHGQVYHLVASLCTNEASSQIMDNFIFPILLKNNKTDWKPIKEKVCSWSGGTIEQNSVKIHQFPESYMVILQIKLNVYLYIVYTNIREYFSNIL
jgi:hypothetical protein